MTVNADTRIADILKARPEALEAIVALSPKFARLRNPILRRMMAGRTSVRMACRIGGCTLNEFLGSLGRIGFSIQPGDEEQPVTGTPPADSFVNRFVSSDIVQLDVRPLLSEGRDPLKLIMKTIAAMREGQALRLVTDFEPLPLMHLLSAKGFRYSCEPQAEGIYHTYFHGGKPGEPVPQAAPAGAAEWNAVLASFAGRTREVDVRALEMPQPMLTILGELETLEDGQALFVYHKRVPLFLIPELANLGYSYRFVEEGPGEVRMLIYRR